MGPDNEFAFSAALAVAERRAAGYNPLFIYGGSGLGKTHLLHAIRNRMLGDNPTLNIPLFSSERFMHDLLISIQNKTRPEFHEKYHREADVMIVDDIQFIATKDYVQEEFFHLFNMIRDAGKQIVIASDRPPKAFSLLQERLRTRFEWGLMVDIQPPNLETRIAILRAKAQVMGKILPDSVSQHIAENTTNVRQIEGIVKKLVAYNDLMNFSISIETAKRAITDLMNENPNLNPTPEMVLQQVCSYYGVEPVFVQFA
ncbi:hypothetical protein FACS1894217_14800 [Clostridia bacterium]|nr:hypothetical protein FACS1894217_14800 [Clostridia bacterium]